MAYGNFTLDQVAQKFALKVREGQLLGEIAGVAPTPWLRETLAKYHPMAFISEKSRSEHVITPILTACRELMNNEVYYYSGITFDVDPTRGLTGECDYLFSWTAPTPILEAPLLVVLEAKKDDVFQGTGQCAAQMLAARIFNEQRQRQMSAIFGCVTTGKDWQFLKLEQSELLIHDEDIFIKDLERILGMLTGILKQGVAEARIAAA